MGRLPCKQNPSFSDGYLYSKEWANDHLRFAIGTLQGKYESSIWKRRVHTALILKEELLEHGYTWQAQRIDFWIHRLQRPQRAADLKREEQRRAP